MGDFDLNRDYSCERRAPRYQVHMRLRVVLPKNKASKCFQAMGEDINEFGMAMFVASELEIGEVVQVDFVLPYQQQKLMVKATVRNRKGFRYGVEFANTSDDDRKAILAACRVLSLLQ
jgi:PilZ domain